MKSLQVLSGVHGRSARLGYVRALTVGLSAFVLMVCFALAAAPFSGPDEGAQVMRAASVAHGQLIGKPHGAPSDAYTTVQVPTVYGQGYRLNACLEFKPDNPASCVPAAQVSPVEVTVNTYVGRYPPLYYLMVGWPSLLSGGLRGVYLMRVVSAAWSALMLGLAALACWRWSTRPSLGLGVMAAASPMALYLGAVVNPNGLEVAAAICLAVSSLILFAEARDDCPRGLVAIVTLAAVVLTSMRALSPLWTVLILLLAVSAGSWRRSWHQLRTTRDLWVGAAIVALSGVLAAVWIVGDHALDLVNAGIQIAPGTPSRHVLGLSVRSVPTWFPQMIGVFGWDDTPLPAALTDIWYAVWALTAAAAVALGSWRTRILLAVASIGSLALCVVIQYSQARRVGLVWHGRYLLPFAAAFILFAVWSIQLKPGFWVLATRVRAAVGVGLVVVLVGAVFQIVRRYSVGIHGSLLLNGRWQPPGGAWPVVVLSAVAAVTLMATLVMGRSPLPGRPVGPLEERRPAPEGAEL